MALRCVIAATCEHLLPEPVSLLTSEVMDILGDGSSPWRDSYRRNIRTAISGAHLVVSSKRCFSVHGYSLWFVDESYVFWRTYSNANNSWHFGIVFVNISSDGFQFSKFVNYFHANRWTTEFIRILESPLVQLRMNGFNWIVLSRHFNYLNDSENSLKNEKMAWEVFKDNPVHSHLARNHKMAVNGHSASIQNDIEACLTEFQKSFNALPRNLRTDFQFELILEQIARNDESQEFGFLKSRLE